MWPSMFQLGYACSLLYTRLRIVLLVLLLLRLLVLAESLRLGISFNALTKGMPEELFVSLVGYFMERPSNLAAMASLVTYGDNGLHSVLQDLCFVYSKETFDALVPMFAENPRLRYIFLSKGFLGRIPPRDAHFFLDNVDMEHMAASDDCDASPSLSSLLQQLDKADPRGLWWPSLAPHVPMDSPMFRETYFEDGPLFRVGMLDYFASTWDTKQIARVYASLASRHEEDPVKKMWSLYGVMRITSIDPNSMEEKDVCVLFETVIKSLKTVPGFELVLRVARFFLRVFRWKHYCHGREMVLLCNMLQGPHRIEFEEEDPVFVKAMLVIVFGSPRFQTGHRLALVDRLIQVFPHLDDLDLSNVLWHVSLFPPCYYSPTCAARMVADPGVRARLMRIAPARLGKWKSLLLNTGLGIAYFRRWLLVPSPREEMDFVREAASDEALLEALYYLPLHMHIAMDTLDGLPVRHKLKGLLTTRLLESSVYRPVTFAGEPHRIWIAFICRPKKTFEQFENIHGFILSLVLRLRLHHESEVEGEGEGEGDSESEGGVGRSERIVEPIEPVEPVELVQPAEPAKPTTSAKADEPAAEITYDLCTEVVDFFRDLVSMPHAPPIFHELFLVYPTWQGEDRRSRRCGPSNRQ